MSGRMNRVNGAARRLRVCYQRSLTNLVFKYFSFSSSFLFSSVLWQGNGCKGNFGFKWSLQQRNKEGPRGDRPEGGQGVTIVRQRSNTFFLLQRGETIQDIGPRKAIQELTKMGTEATQT